MPRYRWSRSASLLLALVAAGAITSPAHAQGGLSGHLGLRVSGFEMVNSADSWDAVYGGTMTQPGVSFELRSKSRWYLSLSADQGDVDGEQVVFLPEPQGTGTTTNLELAPIRLTAGRIFRGESPWSVFVGLGPELVRWEESSEIGSTSASDFGYHATAGLRRNLGRFGLDLSLTYSTVPDALESGAAALLGEDDLGGLTVTLGGAWQLF